jgi:hypothetical protein
MCPPLAAGPDRPILQEATGARTGRAAERRVTTVATRPANFAGLPIL